MLYLAYSECSIIVMDGGGESSDNSNNHYYHHWSLKLDCITFEGRDYVFYLFILWCPPNSQNTQLANLISVDCVSIFIQCYCLKDMKLHQKYNFSFLLLLWKPLDDFSWFACMSSLDGICWSNRMQLDNEKNGKPLNHPKLLWYVQLGKKPQKI